MGLEIWAARFIRQSRVGHLATSTKNGRPHVVPVCFAFDGRSIYSSIDEKPKRTIPTKLRRVINVLQNPNVSFVVDKYDENWRKLRYVMVFGDAKLLHHNHEHEYALSLLRRKYRQYRRMSLHGRPVIMIRPTKIVAWKYR